MAVAAFLTGAVITAGLMRMIDWEAGNHHESAVPRPQPKTLPALLTTTPGELEQCDLALMNLLCAEGLPGSENADVHGMLAALDGWSKRVDSETRRHRYKFREHPEEYNHSEAYFRMLVLITVLQQDFHVRYNPTKIESPESPSPNDVFYSDSQDLFLHGTLGNRRMGTCVSMPVFYVAVGRRLGYPLKLVTARSHLFARWESADGKGRFNIEGTNQGLNCFPDDYYKTWPHPLSNDEIHASNFLKSLTPAEEMALFLTIRGLCLESAGRLPEAQIAYAHAHYLAPNDPVCRQALAASVARESAKSRVATSASNQPPQLSRGDIDAMAAQAETINRQNSERKPQR